MSPSQYNSWSTTFHTYLKSYFEQIKDSGITTHAAAGPGILGSVIIYMLSLNY